MRSITARLQGAAAALAILFSATAGHAQDKALVASNQFTISMSKWDSMTPDRQAKVQECALNFEAALARETIRQEAELVAFSDGEGLKVYAPDKESFSDHVLEKYKASKFSADWPEGLLDKINAL